MIWKDFLNGGFIGVGSRGSQNAAKVVSEKVGKTMNLIGAASLVVGLLWVYSKVRK